MPQALEATHSIQPSADPKKALKILSKSVYRELRQAGYEPTQILALATEVVGLVASDIGGAGSNRKNRAKVLD